MSVLRFLLFFALILLISESRARKRVRDMMPSGARMGSGKHARLQGWSLDTNGWNEGLYPSINHRRGKGKIVAHLTSDSPALVGSNITFTARLEFPKCQKEDENGDLVYEKHCKDVDASVRPGEYVYNWTSWIDDYGFGNCTDKSNCNVFPDGKPFPQRSDWRRNNYVYVWHTMGQYYQKNDRSVSSISLNSTNITLGAQLMELSVYRKSNRRKYSPTATASGIYFVTDQIPFIVNISQKNAQNASDNVFIKDSDIVFNVKIHDPSNYLKKAEVSYKWDFSDGNKLITRSSIATHAYNQLVNYTVKLTIEAIFKVPCGPATPTAMSPTSVTLNPTTAMPSTVPSSTKSSVPTSQETTAVAPSSPTADSATTVTQTSAPPTTVADTQTTATPTTSAASTTMIFNSTTSTAASTTEPRLLQRRRRGPECKLYRYGSFIANLSIVAGIVSVESVRTTNIVKVSTASVTDVTVDFLVKCSGSIPTSACTIILDSTCKVTKNIICDKVPAADQCQLTLQRAFNQSGIFCVNITLSDSASLALASTLVTIGQESKYTVAKEASLVAGVVLVVLIAVAALVLYKRYKVYKPVNRHPGDGSVEGVTIYFSQLKTAMFPGNEERNPLLQGKTAEF
ncbi:protein QNR-71 isoform X1 [Acipenser oxyrinchus oxyrinchus]|uniref:Protein QNR-71 isoform X1 n=1 Tax=Acipenser oxyrinchus oxyrinchus TaxID=40147 RepID=A0AAD8LS84_ACIOX|nr:protein QNR-71 isoform X1 [Acipenser oxyrinchus oxyrinchus]